MSPASAAPNQGHLYLYLPNWYENVVRFGDWSSNLNIGYLELASVRDKYFALVSFWNISFSRGLLWTGHENTSFNPAGSRHSVTFSFGFGTNTDLLHHSAVLSSPRSVTISCSSSCTSSSLWFL